MQSDTERAVTFVANVVAIFVFIASVVGWLGFKVFPSPVTSSKNLIYSLLVSYAVIASYGTAKILRQRVVEQKPSILLSVILGIAYAFSSVYLQDFLTANLPSVVQTEIVGNTTVVMLFAYIFTHFFIYISKLWFPDGFSFWIWFTSAFRKSGLLGAGLLLLYLGGQLYMFSLFRGHL